jgi:hypothetical protein
MKAIASKAVIPSSVGELFAVRPAAVRDLALAARQLILGTLPGAIELADPKANLVGYGYGTGYKDLVATLILSKTGVKIGLVQGASLPDPASLLQGAGKVHRYVDIRTQEQLRRPEVLQLLEMGLSAWRERSATAKEGKPRRSGSVT